MVSRLLYKSLPLQLGLPETAVPHSDVLKGWKIEDEWTPTGDVQHEIALVDYQISISQEIRRHESRDEQVKELFQLQDQAFLLISEIKLLWPLIFGELQSLPRTMPVSNAPECWTANSREVVDFFHPSKGSVIVTISANPWVILPYVPLEKMVTAYTAYESASAPLRTLVELYHDSLHSDGQASMFTLAKALELVRATLPGRTDQAKMQQLPRDVLSVITRDLSWLFMIANNRYEIRHVVRDITGPNLHPQLTQDEKVDFIMNASRVIRGTICQAFGIPFLYSDKPRYMITDHRGL